MKSIIYRFLINAILLLSILPLWSNTDTLSSDGISRLSQRPLPTLEILGGGFICAQDTYHLELRLTGTSPYTILYALDGVIQDPLQLTASNVVWALPESMDFDTLSIFGISNELGIGSIFGTNFLIVTRTLSPVRDTVICNAVDHTYRVIIDFDMFDDDEVVLVSGSNVQVIGNSVEIGSLPYEQDYEVFVTSNLRCDTIQLSGGHACMIPCVDFNPELLVHSTDSLFCEGTNLDVELIGVSASIWTNSVGQIINEGSTASWVLTSGIHDSIQILVAEEDCIDTLFLQLQILERFRFESGQLDIRQPDCGVNNGNLRLDIAFGDYFEEVLLQPIGVSGIIFDQLPAGSYILNGLHPHCPLEIPITLIQGECSIFIPTAFTPNGDGINDRFEVLLPNSGQFKISQMEVLDRWGNVLYSYTSSDESTIAAWDGSNKGMPAEPGNYAYWIVVEEQDRSIQKYTGSVVLIR